MTEPEERLDAVLRIIENPNLHMGPTVPFVFGAMQRPIGAPPEDKEAGRTKLGRLLTTLRTAPPGRGVRIQWCRNIKAYVATPMPFVDDGLAWEVQGCNPNDPEMLLDVLWQLYGSSIMAGEYSIDDNVWHPFTLDEIRTIEDLLDGLAD